MNLGIFLKGFDAYDGHAIPLIQSIRKENENINFFLIHMNSIFRFKEIVSSNEVRLVDVRALSNLKKILIESKIDALIFLETSHIISLYVITLCRELKIKTIFYQHGLQDNVEDIESKGFVHMLYHGGMYGIIRKYFKIYSFLFRNVLYLKHWVFFLRVLFKKTASLITKPDIALSQLFGEAAIKCNVAFVYGEADKRKLIDYKGYTESEIIISGYPLAIPQKDCVVNEKQVLYISSAFRIAHTANISIEEEKKHYLELYRHVVAVDCDLVIKIHPREDLLFFEELFRDKARVRVYRLDNLSELVLESSIVIGHNSTALFYAIKYYKPIIILNTIFPVKITFSYLKFGIGFETNIYELQDQIASLRSSGILIQKENYQRFISDFISEQPIASGKYMSDYLSTN